MSLVKFADVYLISIRNVDCLLVSFIFKVAVEINTFELIFFEVIYHFILFKETLSNR